MVLLYNSAQEIKDEAKMSNFPFKSNEVEEAGEQFEIIVENYTDKNRTANPTQVWVSTDREYQIIKLASKIGGAGLLLQRFANTQETGQKKIDLAYKMLKNLVYGEGTSDGSTSSGMQGGDIIIEGGAFDYGTFETLINEDLNDDLSIG
jgi:hypothetical protein